DIDTGAYHPRSGWLTALDVTNNLVYQVNIFKNYIRALPLEEAVITVNPAKIKVDRRNKN
ncbi:serine/threonine protein phosphatase, partial [Trichormus variabilis 9RC]|nr:serine/threonine protein phosphatase [Trichormus variabilis 9RC]